MDTATLIGLMAALAVVLLLAAIIIDKLLAQRARKRRLAEEAGIKPDKRDAADALIDILGRTGEAVRRGTESARQGGQEPKT